MHGYFLDEGIAGHYAQGEEAGEKRE